MAALIAVNCAEPSAATVMAFAWDVAEEAGVDDEAGEELETIVDEELDAIVDEGADDVSDVDRSDDEESVEVTVEEADVSA